MIHLTPLTPPTLTPLTPHPSQVKGQVGSKIALSPGGFPAMSPLAMELAALGGGAAGAEEEEEEEALSCGVCREGYKGRPGELLGMYCYCRWAGGGERGRVCCWGCVVCVMYWCVVCVMYWCVVCGNACC